MSPTLKTKPSPTAVDRWHQNTLQKIHGIFVLRGVDFPHISVFVSKFFHERQTMGHPASVQTYKYKKKKMSSSLQLLLLLCLCFSLFIFHPFPRGSLMQSLKFSSASEGQSLHFTETEKNHLCKGEGQNCAKARMFQMFFSPQC